MVEVLIYPELGNLDYTTTVSLPDRKPKPGFAEHTCGPVNKFPSSNHVRPQHLNLSTGRHQTLLDFFYSSPY
jgi:hypothetical protein